MSTPHAHDPGTLRSLERLQTARINFDLPEGGWPAPGQGWNLDERVQALPAERPGPPEPEGSWELARRLMRGYEFADPSIVRAAYDPEAPLEDRVMLLELRFWGLRFRTGVRVADVYDETRQVDGREGRVWGWSYRTLEGHLERGEMHWQVWKWLESGEVDFRIHSYSRRAHIANPVVRLGFRLFGRREQMRFLAGTCARMRALTEAALGSDRPGEAVRDAAQRMGDHGLPGADAMHDKLARDVEDARRDRAERP